MRALRFGLIGAGVGILVVLFLVLRPEKTPRTSPRTSPSPMSTLAPTPGPTGRDEIRVQVRDGGVQGPERARVSQGDPVTLLVSADTTDEVHVHGYDVLRRVGPGRPARVSFRADIPGVFEVELEDAGILLLELEVQP